MRLQHRGVAGSQLGPGLIERRARSQAAEDLRHPMFAAGHHGRRQVVRARGHVRDDLGRHRIGNSGLEDTHDGRGSRSR